MRRSSAAAVTALLAATLAGCDRATPVEPAGLAAAPAFSSGAAPTITRTHLKYDVSFQSWSPCTREPIDVSGTFHITVTATVTDGEIRLKSHQNSQGMGGRGVYSGRLYRFISVSPHDHSEQETTSPVWTENGWEMQSGFTWQVVSQGAADNFYSTLKYTIIYDPDDPERSGFTYDKWESGCRG